ncbi:succinate dehydrogenase, hydrophobic membrane anchor protein [Alkalilimnicola ehrlichii MLHE-1]|uniref:Succinate dehydrogenase hydrophobic membrane anchor subunit n=1 Tax=Alkalilimnicola ehrlichii (strain ATCC BAA-1101 / DSM 17681 / MLHE-1) TaxID=187272 RepID=Q0A905_ALKEH|nr:succinate dehydrogenase, hydrophobic membrane anchor protein [Alkalilimnicola ehrlichii]ABI56682.1 succinate dehydrogenase subunit D [Alkalilimnicola ehrlichii MLHE-1]
MNLRTNIKEAQGLGSAKDGVSHWWLQRLTAVALVPLMLWLAFGLARHGGAGYEATVAWVANPMTTVLWVLSLAALFWHIKLGLQVVIEDYVHDERAKFASLIAMKFITVLLAAIAILAVLRVALGS